MKISRNDIKVKINNEVNSVISDLKTKSKELIEYSDEISEYVKYYNKLDNLDSKEYETEIELQNLRDLIDSIAYRLEDIKWFL